MAKFPMFDIHPAADLFPMLPDAELSVLGLDIARNGQRHTIKLWGGKIVDGRNRYAACRVAGIPPSVEDIDFRDEAECIRFIISENIHRRHLTESQRAMIASELAKLGDGQRSDRQGASIEAAMSQGQAADAMQVSRASVQRAREVQEKAPDLAAKVKSGELKVSKAAAMARERTKPTDPDRADDKVVDATEAAHADGYTKKMEAAWKAYWSLDDTEKTAFHDRQREQKMI